MGQKRPGLRDDPPMRRASAKPSRQRQHPLGRAARAFGSLLAAHPRQALGTLAFGLVFSTIAANALWYQPHRVAEPFFATRDLARFNVLPGWHLAPSAAGESDVTTFRIERADPSVVVEGETPPKAAPDGSVRTAALPAQGISQPENVALAVAVQQALIRRGLYNGIADGVIGPRTSAAILFYQQAEGLPETGEVSEELLKSLMRDGGGKTIAPKPVAAEPAAAEPVDIDPVAAAIRDADKAAKAPAAAVPVVKVKSGGDDLAAIIKGAEKPAPAPAPAPASEPAVSGDREVVRSIQLGLIRLGYGDIEPDGVPGPSTTAAIRSFEKHYRLPLTGTPGVKVLQKLRDIGAV